MRACSARIIAASGTAPAAIAASYARLKIDAAVSRSPSSNDATPSAFSIVARNGLDGDEPVVRDLRVVTHLVEAVAAEVHAEVREETLHRAAVGQHARVRRAFRRRGPALGFDRATVNAKISAPCTATAG